MRNWINLVENYLATVSGIRSNQVEVFKNPSRKEWLSCQKHDMVRGFLLGNDLMVWNVYGAVHQMVRDHLQLPLDAIPITIEGDYKGSVYVVVTDNAKAPILHNPKIRDMILDNGFMKKFRDVDIGFFDEAIVGDWED